MPAVIPVPIELEPRRLRTVETFRAPDPWNGGAEREWNLDLFKLTPKGARVVREGRFWGKDVHGLHADGVDRFLPEALSELWQRQRVPTRSLPRLLAEIEPSLRPGDTTPLLHLQLHRWLAAFFALLALGLLALPLRAALPRHEHVMSRLPLHEWLARPQIDGEDLVTDRPPAIAGTRPLAFEPVLPANLFTYPADGRYVLAWFPAGKGHRLLLAAEEQAAALPHLALVGVTVRPDSIGLPAAALAELRARVPDLDTGLVTGLFWTWTDAITPRPWGRRKTVFVAGLAALSALGAVAIYLMIAVPQARRRRQMEWLLARI